VRKLHSLPFILCYAKALISLDGRELFFTLYIYLLNKYKLINFQKYFFALFIFIWLIHISAKFRLKIRPTSKVMQNLTFKIGEISEVDI
jgi:hypothetical protein